MAEARLIRLRHEGLDPRPVRGHGRLVARSFWGRRWCEHLESYSDYANRLPRGRRYVNHGAVLHLEISPGLVEAMVSGTELYNVAVEIEPLAAARWRRIRKACAGRIGTVLELLQGQLSGEVMDIVADRDQGLFPQPRNIVLSCSCPDWADMCKHVAAALYGVGARLDEEPGLLFLLRGVDPGDLGTGELVLPQAESGVADTVDAADLESIFGIELDGSVAAQTATSPGAKAKPSRKKPAVRTRRKAGFRITAGTIRRLREDFGLSVVDFADVIGVSPATVIRWEAAGRGLKVHARPAATLNRLAALRADLLA